MVGLSSAATRRFPASPTNLARVRARHESESVRAAAAPVRCGYWPDQSARQGSAADRSLSNSDPPLQTPAAPRCLRPEFPALAAPGNSTRHWDSVDIHKPEWKA